MGIDIYCKLTMKPSVEESIGALSKRVPYVIATLDARGETAIINGRTFESPARVIENIVDSTGAGDAFLGTALAGICRGENPESFFRRANRNASYVLTQSGARLTHYSSDRLKI